LIGAKHVQSNYQVSRIRIRRQLRWYRFRIRYIELHPIISAAGIGEGQVSWDYEEAKGSKIQGSKYMHMLLKVPKGMKPVVAFL
jgi:hypothetical protein